MANGMRKGEPHRCEEKMERDKKIRTDQKTEPLKRLRFEQKDPNADSNEW